eukprot:maker-scaffold25_size650667-snap-gene-1.18 protein:Tk06692 transcript:maker-scaffold25_size650667-snap-gene-1.18-mRNA-1 annotation:"phospholipase a2 isozymes pa3a pa3b pa5"
MSRRPNRLCSSTGHLKTATDRARSRSLSSTMLLCVRALLTLLGIYSLGVNSHELTSLVKFNNDTFALLKYHGEELSHCELVMVNSREAGSEENIMGELSKKTKVINVLFEAMMDTIQECESLQNKTKSHQKEYSSWSSITSIFKIFSGLSPGTNWCGLGDVAENYFDLGRNFYEDKCCRAHDHCPIKIDSKATRFGLKNRGSYTKSHCRCDDVFYECLKSGLVDAARFHAQEGRLEEGLRGAEALVADGDHLAIGQLVGLLQGGGGGGGGHLLLEVQGDVAELLLDVTDNLPLGVVVKE